MDVDNTTYSAESKGSTSAIVDEGMPGQLSYVE